MKRYRFLALILALAVVSWAQTATQANPPTQSDTQTEKGKCPCCDKKDAVGTEGGAACCARHHKMSGEGKEMASCCADKDNSCCGGKDAKSCMKDNKEAAACCKESCGKDKTVAACCNGKCGKDCENGCCSSTKTKTTAKG